MASSPPPQVLIPRADTACVCSIYWCSGEFDRPDTSKRGPGPKERETRRLTKLSSFRKWREPRLRFVMNGQQFSALDASTISADLSAPLSLSPPSCGRPPFVRAVTLFKPQFGKDAVHFRPRGEKPTRTDPVINATTFVASGDYGGFALFIFAHASRTSRNPVPAVIVLYFFVPLSRLPFRFPRLPPVFSLFRFEYCSEYTAGRIDLFGVSASSILY